MSLAEYNTTVKLFRDTIALKKAHRVPNISNFFTWKIFDSEYGFKEALYNYKAMEKLTCDFHRRYRFDAYMDLGTRNPLKMTDALGGGSHKITPDGEGIYVVDQVLMQPQEYGQFAQDPVGFTKLLFQRRFPNITAKEMSSSLSEFFSFGQYAQKMTKKFKEEFNVPTVFDMTAAILMPVEFFNSSARGLKELSLDMRRHKEALREALDAYFETFTKVAIDTAIKSDSSSYVTDAYTALLAYSFMNVQQFEYFYWPHLKKYIERVVQANKTIYVFCESTMLRFAEFFADVPKGHLILHLEADNPHEVRKKLPNVCIAGGITSDVLGMGTPQQCIDAAKKLIDDLGEGYILSQNRMMSFKNDCKRENLLALNNFVRNYKI